MALNGSNTMMQAPLTDAEDAMLWEDWKVNTVVPEELMFFLTVDDLRCASARSLYTPYAVTQAYLDGNTEDTHDISLVFMKQHGQGCVAGNAAFLWTMCRRIDAKFAPTEEVSKAFKRHGNSTEGLLDIPMLDSLPLVGAYPQIYTANVTARTRDSHNANDMTSFMASQAGWTSHNLPPFTSIIEPLAAYGAGPGVPEEAAAVPLLKGNNGNYVQSVNGNRLRNFDHILPSQISTKISKDPWLLASWVAGDPRIAVQDIIDRMCVALSDDEATGKWDRRNKLNTLRQAMRRWRENNHMMSTRKNGETDRANDSAAVTDLCKWQLRFNTSWQPDSGAALLMRPANSFPDTGPYYRLPHPHPTSPLFSQESRDKGLIFSPRVTRALQAGAPAHSAPSIRAISRLLPTLPNTAAHLTEAELQQKWFYEAEDSRAAIGIAGMTDEAEHLRLDTETERSAFDTNDRKQADGEDFDTDLYEEVLHFRLSDKARRAKLAQHEALTLVEKEVLAIAAKQQARQHR